MNIDCYLDAEWASTGEPLSLQLLLDFDHPDIPSQTFMVLNKKYLQPSKLDDLIEQGKSPNIRYMFHSFQPSMDNITTILHECLYDYVNIPDWKDQTFKKELIDVGDTDIFYCNLYFFYSPKDLWIAFGWKRFKWLLNQSFNQKGSYIQKKRSISGRLVNKPGTSDEKQGDHRFHIIYTFKDISGWTNSSLAALSESVGVVPKEKNSLNQYKTHMEDALLENTDLFIRYAINDVLLLKQIVAAQVTLINTLCRDVLQIDCAFTKETIPMTTGKLDSVIFQRYIETLLDKSPTLGGCGSTALKLAFGRLGILKTGGRGSKKKRALHKALFSHWKRCPCRQYNGPLPM